MIYYVKFLEIRLNVMKVMKSRKYETSNGDVYVYSFVRCCKAHCNVVILLL